ncbi:HNH endonuclease signature motif containing protein [Cellulomonas composti]|uniref:HNH nuclease domain-containing protein n=1 Tax=Cellulomonas composti TaxID=266130 RepID=A0A511JBN1_9CELL|nr:hypothetical protein CCO02nite_20320 [Cellulomonas composti]
MADRYAPLADRFWAKVDKREGCWEWQGGRSEPGGYGRIGSAGRLLLAHRVAYELCKGPILDGLTVDHLCGNRGCVNPAHLELVSRGENSRRYASALERCKHGHEFTPENTRTYQKNGRDVRACRACARRRYHEGRSR